VELKEKLAYSYDSAEAMTDISRHQWRKLVRLGKVRATRIGRRVLISRSELERVTAAGYTLKVPAE